MFARVNSFHADPAKAEQAKKYVNDTIIPAAKKIDGYKGYLALVDRATGKSYGITFWESEAAMKASEEAGTKLRSAAASDLSLSAPTVERMEVLVNTRD